MLPRVLCRLRELPSDFMAMPEYTPAGRDDDDVPAPTIDPRAPKRAQKAPLLQNNSSSNLFTSRRRKGSIAEGFAKENLTARGEKCVHATALVWWRER